MRATVCDGTAGRGEAGLLGLQQSGEGGGEEIGRKSVPDEFRFRARVCRHKFGRRAKSASRDRGYVRLGSPAGF